MIELIIGPIRRPKPRADIKVPIISSSNSMLPIEKIEIETIASAPP
jgi:hypothetical protein